MHAWLTAEYPDDEFKIASIRALLYRMFTEKELVRVRKGTGATSAVFMVAGSDVKTNRFGDRNKVDAAHLILEEAGKPLTLKKIAREMLRDEFETDQSEEDIVKALDSTMRKNAAFVKNGQGWKLAEAKAKG
jgi:hypothetical protein